MRRFLYGLTLCLSASFLWFSCSDDDSLSVPNDLRIADFVWKGMNLYYYWQPEVPDLSDDRFGNQDALNQFLGGFDSPEAVFGHLKVPPPEDRFSVIYSDYRVLEGVLGGTTKNNGVDFSLHYFPGSTTQVFGMVRYILPGSDASGKNIQRGDLFYAVDGVALTASNYQQLLSAESYTLQLAEYDNGNITPTGESVQLNKQVFSENPVHLVSVIQNGSHNIGYLMYNGFYAQYDLALNNAFAALQAQNVTSLVLDLRYNSGGSIQSATYLASMITGQFTGEVFAQEQWNPKLMDFFQTQQPENLLNRFTSDINGTPVNALNLNTVYVLTSRSTASASELVINGLKPYVNVVQIGTATTGKNVGSVTLYDAPNFSKADADPTHFYAMQPIVLKVVDRNGFGDYASGIEPNVEQWEDFANMGTLGDASEPLLQTAIAMITGSGRISPVTTPALRQFQDRKSLNGLQNQMYSNKKLPLGQSFNR